MNKKETDEVSFPNVGNEDNNDFFDFTDVSVFLNNLKGSLFYYSNNIRPQKIKNENIEIFKKFITKVMAVNKSQKSEDFIVYHEKRYFRCCEMKTVEGIVISIRQMPVNFLELQNLNIPDRIIIELLEKRLNKGGLVFICGSPGNGKTTTASALIKKRLELYGGMCITIEDPPEIPLHGEHGKGYCIQTQVKDEGFVASIKTTMRSYPTGQNTMMFVGEVRDHESAIEILKASISGRLVIVTFHSDSVVTGLQRITSLAYEKIGNEAYEILGEAFKLGIHQNLARTTANKLKLKMECLVNTTSAINNIKRKNFNGLRNELEIQIQKLKNNKRNQYHNEKDVD